MMITISTSEAGELIIADPLDSWAQMFIVDESENLLIWVEFYYLNFKDCLMFSIYCIEIIIIHICI